MARSPKTPAASADLRRSRRDRERLPVLVSVRYEDEGDCAFEVRDLSREGMFLCSDLLYELGDRVRLHVVLPGGHEFECGGEIVRVEVGLPGQGQGMGIAFVDLAEAHRDAIDRLLPREGARPRARAEVAPRLRAAGA
jgi:hypothetical protein